MFNSGLYRHVIFVEVVLKVVEEIGVRQVLHPVGDSLYLEVFLLTGQEAVGLYEATFPLPD